MPKQLISVEEFITALNNELPRHIGFVPELRVFLVPEGGEPAGVDWEPKTPGTMAAVSAADAVLKERFKVSIPLRAGGGVTIGGG